MSCEFQILGPAAIGAFVLGWSSDGAEGLKTVMIGVIESPGCCGSAFLRWVRIASNCAADSPGVGRLGKDAKI